MSENGRVTSTGPLRLFAVRDTPLSVDEVIRAVADPRAGGVAVFIGMVRNHDTGQHEQHEQGAQGAPSGVGGSLGEYPGGNPEAHTDAPEALVTGLEYTAHPTALAQLYETAEKVLAEHPVTALAAVHRTGSLAVGDLAVVCAASAAHRAEAFAACRALIDALKARVPIWKREEFEDGSHIWVGC
jgi:molybdopterin synthase catalytic subunit